MKKRIHIIDEYRGIALIAMLIYHTLYDMAVIFGFHFNISWFFSQPMHIFQQCIGISFIFISGMSSTLSKNSLRRSLIIFAAAMGMTIITAILMPSQIIRFGVLHLLGVSGIITAAFMPSIKKLSRKVSLLFSGLFFIIFYTTYNVPNGYINLFFKNIYLPKILYTSKYTFFLSFPHSKFYSSDYYPLIPWIFLFLAGAFLLSALRYILPKFCYKLHVPALAAIGRHTLMIYLLHQPVIYGVLYLICSI